VWGVSDLEMLVERPTPAGTQQNGDNQTFNWGYYDELRSWSWSVPDGQAMRVRVYTSGDSVTLRLNGSTVAINALTEADKRVTVFTIPYSPGTLTAVASRSGKEISRVTFRPLAPQPNSAAPLTSPSSPPTATNSPTSSSKCSTPPGASPSTRPSAPPQPRDAAGGAGGVADLRWAKPGSGAGLRAGTEAVSAKRTGPRGSSAG
jgi:hypothetical protein